MPIPRSASLLRRLLLVALLLLGPAAACETWTGTDATVEIDPARPGAAVLTLGGQRLSATSSAAPDGSLVGDFLLGRDRHAWSLGVPDAAGRRTLRVGGNAIVLTPASGAKPGAKPAVAPGTPGTLKLKRQTLTDPGMGGMASHTVLVPEGWEAEGGGWWLDAQGFFSVLPSHDITVTSPEGVEVDLNPEVSFKFFEANPQMGMPPQRVGQSDGGYPVMPMPQGTDGWRRWILETGMPEAYPDATNVEVREIAVVPELQPLMQQLVGPIQQMIAGQNQQNRQMGLPGGGMPTAASTPPTSSSTAAAGGGSSWPSSACSGWRPPTSSAASGGGAFCPAAPSPCPKASWRSTCPCSSPSPTRCRPPRSGRR